MSAGHLMACHDCDLLHRIPVVPEGMTASCCRCGAELAKPKRNSVARSLAQAAVGLDLLLLSGIQELYLQDMRLVAVLVLITTVLAPLAQLLALLYILLPLKVNRPAPGMFYVFRRLRSIEPWSMMEVFMVGILVSVVKLAKMAHIIPGTAAYCFMALIFVLAACLS